MSTVSPPTDDGRGAAPRPLYLQHGGVDDDPIFATYHPASGAARGSAVVVVSPFGYDDVCAHRPLRALAQDLAAAGHPALRFDLPGAGDSGGGPRDPARLQAWVAATEAAAAWLRRESGPPRLTVIGVGLGGIIAFQAAAVSRVIDDVVLWSTPSRGRALVRELRAFSRLGVSDVDGYDFDPVTMPPLPEGSVESGGFLMSPETVRDLESVDLSTMPIAGAQARRALLLGREDIRPDARLEEALRAAGVTVTTAAGRGYNAMMDEPHRAQAPRETFAAIERWLAAPAPARAVGGSPETGAPAAVRATEDLELGVDGVAVRETPLTTAAPGHGGHLFGILAAPADAPPAGPMTIVLPNVGAERRIGPNRMWVEAARRWAAAGAAVLRLDLAGIGDGGGDVSPWGDQLALYDRPAIDQLRLALDDLERRGLPPRFVLAGMCSGAYWAFQLALEDERIAGLVLVNPRMLLFDETRGAAAEARHLRRLADAGTWREIVRGRLTRTRAERLLRAVAVMVRRAPRALAGRVRSRRMGGDALDLALDSLRDRGARVELRFTDGEPLRADLRRTGHLGRLSRWPNVTVGDLDGPGDTHTLQVVRMQSRAHQVLDDAMRACGALQRADHDRDRSEATA